MILIVFLTRRQKSIKKISNISYPFIIISSLCTNIYVLTLIYMNDLTKLTLYS